jgi:hypothetical protein
MSQRAAVRVTSWLLFAAFAALVVLVATSPGHFVYDEAPFVEYVSLLHRHGFTTEFLNALTGTVGPLYAFVHAAFEPLTGLRPVDMRLVNVLLLTAVFGLLALWLKRRREVDWTASAASVLVIPMTWVMAGIALSEMPALLLVTASLCLQLRGLEVLGRPVPVVCWFAASAVFLGAAVWGRQPYLLLAGVPVLMALLEPRLRFAALLFVAIVLAIALPLFAVWHGLVPPSHQERVQQGLAPINAILSLGYIGLCFFLLAPRTRWSSTTGLAVMVVAAFVANALFGLIAIAPLRTIAERHLSAGFAAAYGNLCGSMFLACGVVFVIWLIRVTWERRDDLQAVALNAGLLCIALSPIFIGHQYSSRYTAMSLPYLILAAEPWRNWQMTNVVTTAIGVLVGAMSLMGYFTQ